jgi:cytochrome c peroxidase
MGFGRYAHRALASGLIFTSVGCADGADAPAPTVCDGTAVPSSECARAAQLQLSQELPAARGNAYADDETAATLGFALFFSTEMGNGVGCPKCHLPELAFTDRSSVSTGKGIGTRNAPTVFNVARLGVMFWDGRADSVWSQPLLAIENPDEMASSRLELAHLIASTPSLRVDYETVFGAMPDTADWPAAGKPGDPAFDGLAPSEQEAVNRVAANVGKAIEAYERKNSTGLAAIDRFLAGDSSALIPAAQRGLRVFLEQKCDSCHSGPMLSDERFHDVGFPSLPGAAPDPGRERGIELLRDSIFNLSGPYADPGAHASDAGGSEAAVFGAFRTPSLRNVTRSPPYGHDGALPSLGEVMELHAPDASEEERGLLLAFLQALNGDYPPSPWNNWPLRQ